MAVVLEGMIAQYCANIQMPWLQYNICLNKNGYTHNRDWKKNLYVKEAPYPKKFRPLEKLPENIFNDWLHNFNIHQRGGPNTPRHPRKQPNLSEATEATPGDSLANKSRSNNQRRSKNKKGKQN